MERSSSRLRVLALLVALMFVALTTRLWYLQVLATDTYQDTAVENSIRLVYTDPLRGLILDASGDPIVANQSSLEVRVTRDALGDQAEAVILRLSELLNVPVADLRDRLEDDRYFPFQAIPVAEFVQSEPADPGRATKGERVKLYIQEHPDLFPGVEVRPVGVREYPEGSLAAHLVGQVGLITAEDYERLEAKGYGQNDTIGRAGLELAYERWLRGTRGVQKFIVNADGEVIRALGSEAPLPGSNVHLTLDVDEQSLVEGALLDGLERARSQTDSEGRALRANAGAVVVMDADTGAIRAMASLPSFEPAWYVKGLNERQAAYLTNDDLAPSLNRAAYPYAPGSSFKPITALTAVQEGVADLNGWYHCTSEYTHPGDESGAVFTNWEASNTYLRIRDALVVSCDTVFYQWGSEFYYKYVNNQLGANGQVLQRRLREWGFGATTGLDVPAEYPGVVPDVAYAEAPANAARYPYGWNPGGDILTMIGAGDLGVTPVQLARAYAAIANGGHLCRPHLMDRITGPGGKVLRDPGERCAPALPYSEAELSYIRTSLADVVAGGTASCAFNGFPLSQLPVMGKTGTAERGSPEFQDTSWFAAMVGPVDQPEYVVVTMVEQGGFGGQVAAPITRDVIERLEGISPLDSPHTGCLPADLGDED